MCANTDIGSRVSLNISFLDSLWFSYTSVDARCFAIVVINGGVEYRHFCIEKDIERVRQEVREYLEKNLGKWDSKHVYFQVLPLASRPEKGRGSSKDVRVGQWLWCDLDYKQVVEKPEFVGCKEGQDHSLECYYEDSGKWIHVKRPRLSEVLEGVRAKLGIEPTIVVDSGAGYHLYFKLSSEVDSSVIRRLEGKLVDVLGGDPQSKDLARILRLPGSVNPRVGRLVSVVYTSTSSIEPEYLEVVLESKTKAMETLGERPREFLEALRATGRELRELSDTEILRITELLKDAYRPGYRQYLILYLSGWLAKARISPLSALKIAKAMYESTGDTDPLKTRLSAIVYSYKKAGIDIDSYASEIEQLTGIKPYGLDKEISEEKIKGRSGLQEVLEETLGEERALSIIHELSETLGTLSPFRDSIIELLDYEKQLYAVANLKKLVIVRARREGNELRYKERVAVVAPTKVVVYDNPLGGIRKYEIVFEGSTLRRPLTIGPAIIEEIANRVKAEGLVYHSRLWLDTLNAIINAFVRKGKAEIRTEIESPGFYLVDNRVVSVKYDTVEPDRQRLKESLELLNELAVWFMQVQDRYATVVKWGGVAPFSYVIKQRGRWIRWLYLYGDPDTGKTTLGDIVLKMWGLGNEYEKPGASIDTQAKLGAVLSSTTFPLLINEPGGVLSKEDLIETVKNAVDRKTARSKHVHGIYVDYPALAPLIFTSNTFLPRDDALLKRFLVITFSFGEKIPLERQKEFKQKVEPRLSILSEVGRCIAWLVVNNVGILELEPLEAGKQLLAKCYEMAGLEVPKWLEATYEESEDYVDIVLEQFSEKFKELVNKLYALHITRVIEADIVVGRYTAIDRDKVDFRKKLEILLQKNLIPGVKLRNNRMYILTTLLRELELNLNLKSLAEIIGCEYTKVSEKIEKKVINYAATICDIDTIVELVT